MPCSRAESIVEVRFEEIRGARAASAMAMPAQRIDSSRATSWRVRSGISSPERAGSAMPIPAPARTCGTTVHQAEAAGSSARQPTPPATSRQPAIARVCGLPGSREERIAATGRTLTASAAASGSMLQPETSSRTTRKITAVSEAESSPRASDSRSLKAPGRTIGIAAVVGHRRCSLRAASRATSMPGQHDRRLGEEDRPPVEGLGERAADRRADGDPEDRRGDPHPPAGARPTRIEELEGGDQPSGPTERLDAAQDQQEAERVGDPTAERGRDRTEPGRRRRRERRRSGGRARRRGGAPAPGRPCRRRGRAQRPRRSRGARPGSTAGPA